MYISFVEYDVILHLEFIIVHFICWKWWTISSGIYYHTFHLLNMMNYFIWDLLSYISSAESDELFHLGFIFIHFICSVLNMMNYFIWDLLSYISSAEYNKIFHLDFFLHTFHLLDTMKYFYLGFFIVHFICWMRWNLFSMICKCTFHLV